jgi:hypothetical protein
MTAHVTMEQLLALRDGDRSEPGLAEAQRHFTSCHRCQVELDRLYQRTARLRALPTLSPATDEFPAVRQRMTLDRRQRRWRGVATVGLAAAASLVITVIGRDLLMPTRLDAEQSLRGEISRSQLLEQKLHAFNPDERVMDGRTIAVVIQLENEIASIDARLAETARLENAARVERELKLWRERVGLMNALVDAHLTRASNVGL